MKDRKRKQSNIENASITFIFIVFIHTKHVCSKRHQTSNRQAAAAAATTTAVTMKFVRCDWHFVCPVLRACKYSARKQFVIKQSAGRLNDQLNEPTEQTERLHVHTSSQNA